MQALQDLDKFSISYPQLACIFYLIFKNLLRVFVGQDNIEKALSFQLIEMKFCKLDQTIDKELISKNLTVKFFLIISN